jgi:hypothetical protein
MAFLWASVSLQRRRLSVSRAGAGRLLGHPRELAVQIVDVVAGRLGDGARLAGEDGPPGALPLAATHTVRRACKIQRPGNGTAPQVLFGALSMEAR